MTKHALAIALLPLVLAASPARAQVVQVVVAPDIDVTINSVVNVVVLPPSPVPAVPVPSVGPPPSARTTELHFASGDAGEPCVISVYREEPTWDYEPLCVTPCTLTIENGIHDFMAGRHRTFQVYAIGGVQYWTVEDNNLGGIIAGSVMTGLGGFTALIGGLASGYDPYDRGRDMARFYGVVGAGAGLSALGLVIWLCSYGFAEQTTPTDGFIPVGDGVGLLPTVFANEGAAGDREWGVGLGVRF